MDAIFETFNTLAARPGIGHQRPDLTSRRVRFWTVLGRYMIVYREQPDGIEIVRGLAAGRDVTTVLKG
jgi:antitoxin ParD1/3/4/toxin ParE1/3/4